VRTGFEKSRLGAVAAVGAAALLAAPAPGHAAAMSGHCFAANQWQGWSAPNPSEILIRVNLHDIYRLELTAPTPELQFPDVHLDTVFEGSDWVCTPLDLQMWVSDQQGFREPLIVKSITELSRSEAAAIPPKYRP